MDFHSLYTLLITLMTSISIVDVCRVFVVLTWGYVFYQSFGGLKAVVFGSRNLLTVNDRNDAWVAGVAASMVFFQLRWYVNADSETLYASLHLFTILMATTRIFTYRSDRELVKETG